MADEDLEPGSASAAADAEAGGDVDPAELGFDGGEAGEDVSEPEGSSPEGEGEVEAAAEESSSEEPAVDHNDPETWGENERSTYEQYKRSPFEAVKALGANKAYGAKLGEELRAAKARIAELERGAGPSPAKPAEEAPPINTPQIRQAEATLTSWADAYDVRVKEITQHEQDIAKYDRDLVKLEGKIEDLEEEAKNPEVDDYRKGIINDRLRNLRDEQRLIKADRKAAELDLRTKRADNNQLADTYKDLKQRVQNERVRIATEADRQNRERQDKEAKKAKETSLITNALARARKDFGIGPDQRGEFEEELLQRLYIAGEFNQHVSDLDTFFRETAEKRAYRRGNGTGTADYAKAKIRDQSAPAPAGKAAVAKDKTPPLTSREAHRRMVLESRRIPFNS